MSVTDVENSANACFSEEEATLGSSARDIGFVYSLGRKLGREVAPFLKIWRQIALGSVLHAKLM